MSQTLLHLTLCYDAERWTGPIDRWWQRPFRCLGTQYHPIPNALTGRA